MPLIDGVGDEVIQFVAVILVVIVAALAWWSTNARPDRYRTVLVMRSRAHRPVTVSIRRTTSIVPRSSNPVHASTSISIGTNTPTPEVVPRRASQENTQVIPLQEMDSIVDADMAMMDNNRLHFYRMIDSPNTSHRTTETQSEESEAHEESEPASNAQIREMDSIVSAMEADVTAGCDFFTRATQSHSALTSDEKKTSKENKKPPNSTEESSPEDSTKTEANVGSEETRDTLTETPEVIPETQDGVEAEQHTVLIKLKYLNDTLKEVQCNLDDLLKDFKLRHFSRELSSQCRVVLIFRGRVLGDEAATLRACGLHHHAVVHCLVHPNRGRARATPFTQAGALPENASTNDTTHELVTESPPAGERVWDLENILMTLVSVALTVVWFFRCEYSSMFTASASVALFGLTVFYSVAIFGLYLSDAFHFERRPNAQVAN